MPSKYEYLTHIMKRKLRSYGVLSLCSVLLSIVLVFDVSDAQWFRVTADVSCGAILILAFLRTSSLVEWMNIAEKTAALNLKMLSQVRNAQRETNNYKEECTCLRARVNTLSIINANMTKQKDRVDHEFLKVCKENRHLEAELKRKNYN